ncbi:MAG TPA: multiheme c-type cytochrome [Solimonas sp.]|nr:multiheme c-type cytochrome [Solimonas sp.]
MRHWTTALLLLSFGAAAADPVLPFAGSRQHAGVATCAGGNCHGSSKPFEKSAVLQNEYFLWESKDAHSNAYRLLLGKASQQIAANLGIKSAQDAPECLACHTNYVPPERRGRRFQLTEGVGCEACHGAAQDWLETHVSAKTTHAANLAAGLYPLEDPAARARLCLHCHLGSDAKPITHRIMGAGHPPLAFELDTFTSIQPAHFRVDKDYRERKPYAPGLKTWAVGQLVSAQFLLDGLASARFPRGGVIPELVFFDCNACHHPMKPLRWNAGLAGALGPGEVRIADAGLVNAGHVLATWLPGRSAQWDKQFGALHASMNGSIADVQAAARALRELALAATAEMAGKAMRKEDALALLDRMTRYALERDAGDLTAAQQTSMALDSVSAFLAQEHGVKSAAFKQATDAVFATVDLRNNYDPAAFRAAITKVRAALPSLK